MKAVRGAYRNLLHLNSLKQPNYVAVQRICDTDEIEQFKQNFGHANSVGFT